MAVAEPKGKDAGDTLESFGDLGVPVGSAITLETVSPVRKLTVKLLGYSDGRSLMVSAPTREGKEILLERGETVAARFLHRNKVCGFESKVVYRSIQPYSYYHLEYPKTLNVVQIRDSERVDLSIKVQVESEFDGGMGDWPQNALIKDISKSGISVTSRKALGEVGHELVLRFDLPVAGITKSFVLEAIIRNRNVINAKEGKTAYVYGMQFQSLEDSDKLALASYTYEQSL
ncbi:MAG: flagellar brake protein [Hahellaceae bacterium]|nr:flagellar brake protein [Hahellaceae bacterium]